MPYSHVGAGIHPLDQFVPVHDHALADRDCREALGVHQFVGVGPGNAEHRGHLICGQRQRELINRSIGFSFFHRASSFFYQFVSVGPVRSISAICPVLSDISDESDGSALTAFSTTTSNRYRREKRFMLFLFGRL